MTITTFDSTLHGSQRRAAIKALSPRMTSKSGRVLVARMVVAGRRVPPQGADPLALPFTQRPSVVGRYAALTGLTLSEARIHLSGR